MSTGPQLVTEEPSCSGRLLGGPGDLAWMVNGRGPPGTRLCGVTLGREIQFDSVLFPCIPLTSFTRQIEHHRPFSWNLLVPELQAWSLWRPVPGCGPTLGTPHVRRFRDGSPAHHGHSCLDTSQAGTWLVLGAGDKLGREGFRQVTSAACLGGTIRGVNSSDCSEDSSR